MSLDMSVTDQSHLLLDSLNYLPQWLPRFQGSHNFILCLKNIWP